MMFEVKVYFFFRGWFLVMVLYFGGILEELGRLFIFLDSVFMELEFLF